MNTLSFLAALVAALAWPAAVVVLALLFRAPITQLLQTARKLRGWGLEFERGVEELESKAAQLPPPPVSPPGTDMTWLGDATKALREQAQAVAEIAPPAAVSLAWATVEQRLREVTSKLLPDGDRLKGRFAIAQIDALLGAQVIDQNLAAVLHQMRDLRNRAAHPETPDAHVTITEAKGYVDVAASVIEYLGAVLRYAARS